MAKKKIRLGIMGAGMGRCHASCFAAMKNDVEITAVCEKNTALHSSLDQYLAPGAKYYTEFDEFIHSGIDAVVLANYFSEHAMFAIKAFEAGVDVLSETTAAPTLKDCVDLVEAAEKYGRKYTLALNCGYFCATHQMKQLVKSGKVGKVLYGEAEYHHKKTMDMREMHLDLDMENLHWGHTMPTSYYNMHSLGALMYITDAMPVMVSCMASRNSDFCREDKMVTDSPSAVVLTKMDTGAVFSSSGRSNLEPTSKWFRLNCEKGCLETDRSDWRLEHLIYGKSADYSENTIPGPDVSGLDNDEIKEIKKHADTSGHGGINFYTSYHFIKYLQGEEKSEFDVYKAAALSAVGVLSWYSALTDKMFRVPDFKNPEDREKVRYDSRSPFAKSYNDLTVPCRLDEKDKFDLYDEKYKFGL